MISLYQELSPHHVVTKVHLLSITKAVQNVPEITYYMTQTLKKALLRSALSSSAQVGPTCGFVKDNGAMGTVQEKAADDL